VTRQLYVDKAAGTFADQLLAFGLGLVTQDILRRAHRTKRLSVTLRDQGSYYQLDLGAPLDDASLRLVRSPYMPIPIIVTRKNAAQVPADLPEECRVDYEAERDKRRQFFQTQKQLSKEARAAWRRREPCPETSVLLALQPHPDWDIFRAINPASLAGYNKVTTRWWRVQDSLQDMLRLLRDLFSRTPNNITAALDNWKALSTARGWDTDATVTAGQLLNPSQGKGQNRPKADRLTMGNVKDFWPLEWLRAVGLYRAALTKQLRGSKDRKTYVLAPVEIDLSEHEQIFGHFRKEMQIAQTAIQSDILASLRYTRVLLNHALSEQGQGLFATLTRAQRPNRLVAGFASAFYKNLGNSSATMNLPFIGLPGWLHVTSREEVRAAQNLVEEHESVVRQFDESHSDDHGLLLAYRDFCSGEDLEAFFAFVVPYSGYVIGHKERNQYVCQFTQTNLRRLIMGSDPKLGPVLDTPGFQNIAYAIRQSTVVAQYRKKQGNRRYNVRYGLGQQLARKAHYPDEFIAELSDFLHKYNAENAQIMETRPGPYRRSIRQSDIEEIVALIDQYGSRTICNLLVAYGYARSSAGTSTTEHQTRTGDAERISENKE